MVPSWALNRRTQRDAATSGPTSPKRAPALAQVVQRLVLVRLFLPLVVVSMIAIGAVAYSGERTLENQQQQRAQYMARISDRFLDQAQRTLDAVARVAEVAPRTDLGRFMQNTWEAYGYFDTLYYLDPSGRISVLAPSDPRYLGLDLSHLPDFQRTADNSKLVISRPFISVRTGNPTVYLSKHLARGGQVVGELSLQLLQEETTYGRGILQHDMIFILDQSGMLLAHPSFNLVRERTNQSDLAIFRLGLSGGGTLVYEYEGTRVVGSAKQIKRAGWVVVDQVALTAAVGPYVWTLGLTLLASLIIWLLLAWVLRGQLQRHVVTPLVHVSQGIGALAKGDFRRGKALATVPPAFAELDTLIADFQQMSDALQARQVALQESEQRYRLVFEGSPVSIWEEDFTAVKAYFDQLRAKGVTDFRTHFQDHPADIARCVKLIKVVDVNQATLTLLRAADKQSLLAGLPVGLADLRSVVLREEMIILAEGGLQYRNGEATHHTLDGGQLQVSVHLSVAPGSEQSLRTVLVSIVDVTEQRRAEEQIRRLNTELEQRVLDRTRELEVANQELEAFAYSVSHDLRAPVRHIAGFTDLLRERTEDTLDEPARRYLSKIAQAAVRMGDLIDGLLAFSRLGRNEMTKHPVDLNTLIGEIVQESTPETKGRTVDWRIATLPVVIGDPATLRQVLTNLISNALKFTRARERTEIEIGCSPDGPETVVYVRDNGVGFDMAFAENLFGVFQRLHRADQFEGTGIGLANARRIITRHGGRVWAQAKPDEGATFYVCLPRDTVPPRPA